LTRFSLAYAAITGEGFWTSAQRALYNLKGRFVKLFEVNATSKLVLYSGGLIFSFCIALLAFKTALSAGGPAVCNPYGPSIVRGFLFDPCLTGTWEMNLLLIIVWLFGLYLMYYPLVAIIVVSLLTTVLAPTFGYAWLFAIFVGALSNYMLCYFAGSVLDVVTALFVIGIINEKNGSIANMDRTDIPPGSAKYVCVDISDRMSNAGIMAVPVATAVPLHAVPIQGVQTVPQAQAVTAVEAQQITPMAIPAQVAPPAYTTPAGAPAYTAVPVNEHPFAPVIK